MSFIVYFMALFQKDKLKIKPERADSVNISIMNVCLVSCYFTHYYFSLILSNVPQKYSFTLDMLWNRKTCLICIDSHTEFLW